MHGSIHCKLPLGINGCLHGVVKLLVEIHFASCRRDIGAPSTCGRQIRRPRQPFLSGSRSSALLRRGNPHEATMSIALSRARWAPESSDRRSVLSTFSCTFLEKVSIANFPFFSNVSFSFLIVDRHSHSYAMYSYFHSFVSLKKSHCPNKRSVVDCTSQWQNR